MAEKYALLQPGDKIRVSSIEHQQDANDPKGSAPMTIQWIETLEDGTRIIWVRRP